MEDLSTRTESARLIHLCARCVILLARWQGSGEVAEKRTDLLSDDIRALSATYEALNNSLRSSDALRAIQTAESISGGNLVEQFSSSIADCEDTLAQVVENLSRLDDGRGPAKAYRNVVESLTYGELLCLQKRVQVFNNILALPLHLIRLTIQLQDMEIGTNMSTSSQLRARLQFLEESIRRRENMLEDDREMARSTNASQQTHDDDELIYAGLSGCLKTAQRFIAAANIWITTGSIPSAAELPLGSPVSARDAFGPMYGIRRSQTDPDMLKRDYNGIDLLGDSDDLSGVAGMTALMASSPTTASPLPMQDHFFGNSDEDKKAAKGYSAHIKHLCASGDYDLAATEALKYLQVYTTSPINAQHAAEIRDNIVYSRRKGLAGTGHGLAPLHFFATLSTEHAPEVQSLIDDGVDVNASSLLPNADPRSRPPCHTALQMAADRGHLETTRQLIASPSINLNLPDSRDITPLFIAWRKGHHSLVHLLLSAGADFEPSSTTTSSSESYQGNTLLHGAAWLGKADLVRLLISKSASINAQNALGTTPLIAACISADIANPSLRRAKLAASSDVCRLLVNARANFRIKNNAGHTAMYYAEQERNLDVVALLEGKGARRAFEHAHPRHPHDVVGDVVNRGLGAVINRRRERRKSSLGSKKEMDGEGKKSKMAQIMEKNSGAEGEVLRVSKIDSFWHRGRGATL